MAMTTGAVMRRVATDPRTAALGEVAAMVPPGFTPDPAHLVFGPAYALTHEAASCLWLLGVPVVFFLVFPILTRKDGQARSRGGRRWWTRLLALVPRADAGSVGLRVLASALLLLAWPVLAAAHVRFEIDPTQDMDALARTGRVAIALDRVHGVYTLDASAVLAGRAPDLLRVALDYERYASMGVPHLRESHVVAVMTGEDTLYAWTWMSGLGRSSKQYLRVRV
jgi:hypothetical protein